MKKILQVLAALVCWSGLMVGAAAAQQQRCDVNNTGPGSQTNCDQSQTNNFTENCNNNVGVNNTNSQDSTSGNSNNSNNTNNGSSSTGSTDNSNSTSMNVNAGCGVNSQRTSPPPSGGQGSGPAGAAGAAGGAGATAAAAISQAASLPKTGAGDLVATAGFGSLAVGALGLLARFGSAAYRQFAL